VAGEVASQRVKRRAVVALRQQARYCAAEGGETQRQRQDSTATPPAEGGQAAVVSAAGKMRVMFCRRRNRCQGGRFARGVVQGEGMLLWQAARRREVAVPPSFAAFIFACLLPRTSVMPA